MSEQEFQEKLGQLINRMGDLPGDQREKMEKMVEQTKGRHDRMKKSVGELQESLDYLRLSVKYLVFDLEATRRENQYLRGLLNKANGNDSNEGAD